MEKIKESWQVIVFTMIVTLLGSLFLSSIINRNDKVNNSASKEYVDEQDDKIYKVLDNKADKDDVEDIKKNTEYTMKRVDKIYEILVTNE